MTQPHPQPKEYTTTLENICEGCGMCRRKEDDLRECCILERVRSRPHAPQPADAVLDAFDELLFDVEQIHQEESTGDDDAVWDKIFHAIELRKASLRGGGAP